MAVVGSTLQAVSPAMAFWLGAQKPTGFRLEGEHVQRHVQTEVPLCLAGPSQLLGAMLNQILGCAALSSRRGLGTSILVSCFMKLWTLAASSASHLMAWRLAVTML